MQRHRSIWNLIADRLDQVLVLFYEEVALALYFTLDESIAGFAVPKPGDITYD